MSIDIDVCYTSCACNQTPTAAHWGKNKLICFASCNSVRIYDPNWGSGGKIIESLIEHSKRVNSVRWISGDDYETELVSGSTDGTAIVWSYDVDEYVPFVLKGHEGNVNIVDALYKDAMKKFAVVVTASVDSTVRVWTRKALKEDFFQSQCINFGYGISMALRLSFLPYSNTLILASGMDDSKIQLYIERDDDKESNGVNFVTSEVLKGHESWVRGLDFVLDDSNDLILASSSQDTTIRLWRISEVTNQQNGLSDEANKYELILKKSRIKIGAREFIVSLESVLAGHESWVYSVSWNSKDFTLLSASLDKSMIIWGFDTVTGLWLEKVRVGEVGGNTIGFYGGMFGPDEMHILAHGYHGAFHIWNFLAGAGIWKPAVTVNGHFNEVVDLAWEPDAEFLLTVSTDQTTRIHASWAFEEKPITWHEIARPQVHGYDMSCIAVLSRYKFASGAEEKIIRTFEAPRNFVENFRRICEVSDDEEGDYVLTGTMTGPQGAAVPSLGLSNKAVYENDNIEQATPGSNKEPYPEESHFTSTYLIEPPTEETLLQNTLWPEIQKLYGHGYEVYTLAADPEGYILASACKATTTEHAAILLWDTSTWTQTQKLISHNLTVAQLAFSPNANHLLSVSRDRRWTLFSKNEDTDTFEMVATTDKKTGIHTRIIWCCAWSPDSKYFATGSRDGKVVVWTKNLEKSPESVLGQYEAAGQHLELKGESVTALAFAPIIVRRPYMIAVGLESGIIRLYKWDAQGWDIFAILDQSVAHHLAVKRLAFRPVNCSGNKRRIQLASCGSDHAVRIFDISLPL